MWNDICDLCSSKSLYCVLIYYGEFELVLGMRKGFFEKMMIKLIVEGVNFWVKRKEKYILSREIKFVNK